MEFNATFLATIISFIVFVFLMNKVLYAPILNIIEERKNYIEKNHKSAIENNEKTNAIIAEIEDKKSVAKDDAKNQYGEIIDEYKAQKNQLIQEAKEQASNELKDSDAELTNASNNLKEELKNSMLSLANDIVEKIIGYKSEEQGFDNNKVNEILYK